jgi:Cu/Ag efflux pump CusA
VPLVVIGAVPGSEIVHPMAIVIIGGLVTSTLLNLFVLPALYSVLRPKVQPERQAEPETVMTKEMSYAAE